METRESKTLCTEEFKIVLPYREFGGYTKRWLEGAQKVLHRTEPGDSIVQSTKGWRDNEAPHP